MDSTMSLPMPSDLVGRLLKAVEAMKASAKRLRLGVDGPLNADALDEGCIAVTEAASALRAGAEPVGYADGSRFHELREGRLNMALWSDRSAYADTPLYTQPATPASGWMPTPESEGWYWHFDGDVMRVEFVFPRPGHGYLAVAEESNPTTGKRQFRIASKLGGQWYGPLPLPTPPASKGGE